MDSTDKGRALALITTSFPIEGDGSEAAGSFVFDICSELAKHTRLIVVAPGRSKLVSDYQGIKVVRYIAPLLPLSLLKPINPRHWRPLLATMRAGQSCLEEVCKAENITHILCLWALPCGYWARNIKKHSSVTYSTWALGSDIWTLSKIPVIKGILRSVLHDADHRFADGLLLKEDVERISGTTCEFIPSVRNLPTGEVRKFASEPPYRISYLGRWHPNKGIDLLLEALLLLPDTTWPLIKEVCISGGGPLQNLVEAQVVKLRGEGRPIKLGGYLGKNEAAEFLGQTDYLVLPSRIESIPVIFSDSLQAGCPLVASPAGDLPRLIGKYETGILSSSVSAPSLAEALQRAMATPPSSYAKAISRARLDFSVEQTAIRLLQKMHLIDTE